MVTEKKIKPSSNKRKNISSLLVLVTIVILINFIGSSFFKRFDLTSEKRYTLAESTKNLLKTIEDEVYLKVYLQGDFNPSFTRLKNETKEILDEFRAFSNNQIQYEFIKPGDGLGKEEVIAIEKQLFDKGIMPEEVMDRGKDKTTQTLIWPGAIVSYKGKETAWQIFKRQEGISPEESINNSVEEFNQCHKKTSAR
jgi:ABC-2 type transport system permease protein